MKRWIELCCRLGNGHGASQQASQCSRSEIGFYLDHHKRGSCLVNKQNSVCSLGRGRQCAPPQLDLDLTGENLTGGAQRRVEIERLLQRLTQHQLGLAIRLPQRG
jgi:hypothetical protein